MEKTYYYPNSTVNFADSDPYPTITLYYRNSNKEQLSIELRFCGGLLLCRNCGVVGQIIVHDIYAYDEEALYYLQCPVCSFHYTADDKLIQQLMCETARIMRTRKELLRAEDHQIS